MAAAWTVLTRAYGKSSLRQLRQFVRQHVFEWPWKRWARNRRQLNEWCAWITNQQRALEAGEEIEPPWVAFPDEDPWWIGWRQGNAEGWLNSIWLPFWSKLDEDRKHAYVKRWNARRQWRAYVLDGWDQADRTKHGVAEFVLNKDAFTRRATGSG